MYLGLMDLSATMVQWKETALKNTNCTNISVLIPIGSLKEGLRLPRFYFCGLDENRKWTLNPGFLNPKYGPFPTPQDIGQ